MADERLAQTIEELEAAAGRLRAGNLPSEAAAELVERCARLAAEAADQLDRLVRAEPATGGEDQLRLGGG